MLSLEVHEALQKRVVVGRVKPGRTSADANMGVESGRLLDELKARDVAQLNLHFASAAPRSLSAQVRGFAVGLACTVTLFLMLEQ